MAVKRTRGFTLLELMIVTVIVGVLAAIVLPAYQSQVRKGNRSAAQQFMQDVATREQQILLDTRGYVSVSDGNFGNSPSNSTPGVGLPQPDTTSGKYTYAVAAVNGNTPPTFTITATAINGQDSDANLHLLKLDEQGNRTTWNSSGTKTGAW
jgi:type IV pilus assembly protein PilE